MTNNDLFQILRPVIQQLTGLGGGNVLLADQNALAPKGPYCTIRPRQSVRQRGQANLSVRTLGPLRDVETTVKRQVVCSCSIQFFRGEARQFAELVAEMNKLPSVQMTLLRAKVGWGGASAVNDLTALQAANWEQRAQVTVDLWYETTSVDVVNAILSAEVRVENEKGRVLQVMNVTAAP